MFVFPFCEIESLRTAEQNFLEQGLGFLRNVSKIGSFLPKNIERHFRFNRVSHTVHKKLISTMSRGTSLHVCIFEICISCVT